MDVGSERERDVGPARETTRRARSEGEARERTEDGLGNAEEGFDGDPTTDEKRTARRDEKRVRVQQVGRVELDVGYAARSEAGQGTRRARGACESSPLRGSRRTRLRTQFSGNQDLLSFRARAAREPA